MYFSTEKKMVSHKKISKGSLLLICMISHILCVQNFANQGQLSRLKVLQSVWKKVECNYSLIFEMFSSFCRPFLGCSLKLCRKKYQYQNAYLLMQFIFKSYFWLWWYVFFWREWVFFPKQILDGGNLTGWCDAGNWIMSGASEEIVYK